MSDQINQGKVDHAEQKFEEHAKAGRDVSDVLNDKDLTPAEQKAVLAKYDKNEDADSSLPMFVKTNDNHFELVNKDTDGHKDTGRHSYDSDHGFLGLDQKGHWQENAAQKAENDHRPLTKSEQESSNAVENIMRQGLVATLGGDIDDKYKEALAGKQPEEVKRIIDHLHSKGLGGLDYEEKNGKLKVVSGKALGGLIAGKDILTI